MRKSSNNKRKKYSNNKNQRSEILGIILFSASLVVIIGILTGDQFLGQIGKAISEYFAGLTFGLPVIVLPGLMAIFAIILLFHRPFKGFFVFSLYCIIVMLLTSLGCGLLRFLYPDLQNFSESMSGFAGGFAAVWIHGYVGTLGSSIIWITLLVLFILRAGHISLHAVAEVVHKVIVVLGQYLLVMGRFLKNTWIWLKPKLNSIIQFLILALRSRPKSAEKEKVIKKEVPVPRKDIPTEDATESPRDSSEKSEPELQKEAWEELASLKKKEEPSTRIPEISPSPSAPSSAEQEEIKFAEVKETEDEIEPVQPTGPYKFPGLDLLDKSLMAVPVASEEECRMNAEIIETTLADFGVEAKVVRVNPGPVITLYEVSPAPGVKISKIAGLADDLALVMKAKGIRIIAPIPGKSVVGIEIPNASPSQVYIREIIGSKAFQDSSSKLTIALGKTIGGDPFCADLAKMPHLLIAGSTGAGKSVGINTIIASILYKAHPTDVQFIMIDPKKLELSLYQKLKKHHLLTVEGLKEDVITKPQNATIVLRSVEKEMEQRYELLAGLGVRNISDYNKRIKEIPDDDEKKEQYRHLPYIIIVIDELADLMMVGAKEVEEPIARLAQMSRAVGIHLVIATQRPSVDVLTGMIKANFSARISYQVATKVDSRTILDMNGAEQLLGKGDMLFLPTGEPKPFRIQNAFASTEEVERIVSHVSSQPIFVKEPLTVREEKSISFDDGLGINGQDALLPEARKLVIRHQQGSISLLQRRLKVGYSRAARLIDLLEEEGIVGPFDGSKARQVLVDERYLEHMDD